MRFVELHEQPPYMCKVCLAGVCLVRRCGYENTYKLLEPELRRMYAINSLRGRLCVV
jgi:hypothetical protein